MTSPRKMKTKESRRLLSLNCFLTSSDRANWPPQMKNRPPKKFPNRFLRPKISFQVSAPAQARLTPTSCPSKTLLRLQCGMASRQLSLLLRLQQPKVRHLQAFNRQGQALRKLHLPLASSLPAQRDIKSLQTLPDEIRSFCR